MNIGNRIFQTIICFGVLTLFLIAACNGRYDIKGPTVKELLEKAKKDPSPENIDELVKTILVKRDEDPALYKEMALFLIDKYPQKDLLSQIESLAENIAKKEKSKTGPVMMTLLEGKVQTLAPRKIDMHSTDPLFELLLDPKHAQRAHDFISRLYSHHADNYFTQLIRVIRLKMKKPTLAERGKLAAELLDVPLKPAWKNLVYDGINWGNVMNKEFIQAFLAETRKRLEKASPDSGLRVTLPPFFYGTIFSYPKYPLKLDDQARDDFYWALAHYGLDMSADKICTCIPPDLVPHFMKALTGADEKTVKVIANCADQLNPKSIFGRSLLKWLKTRGTKPVVRLGTLKGVVIRKGKPVANLPIRVISAPKNEIIMSDIEKFEVSSTARKTETVTNEKGEFEIKDHTIGKVFIMVDYPKVGWLTLLQQVSMKKSASLSHILWRYEIEENKTVNAKLNLDQLGLPDL